MTTASSAQDYKDWLKTEIIPWMRRSISEHGFVKAMDSLAEQNPQSSGILKAFLEHPETLSPETQRELSEALASVAGKGKDNRYSRMFIPAPVLPQGMRYLPH